MKKNITHNIKHLVVFKLLLLFPSMLLAKEFYIPYGLTITLTQDWKEIPKNKLISAYINNVKNKNSYPNTWYRGYTLKLNKSNIYYPYLLTEINESGIVSETYIKKYTNEINNSMLSNIKKSLKNIEDIKLESSYYDYKNNTIFSIFKIDIGDTNKERIIMHNAVKLTNKGYIQITGYSEEINSYKYIILFKKLSLNIKLKDSLQYKQNKKIKIKEKIIAKDSDPIKIKPLKKKIVTPKKNNIITVKKIWESDNSCHFNCFKTGVFNGFNKGLSSLYELGINISAIIDLKRTFILLSSKKNELDKLILESPKIENLKRTNDITKKLNKIIFLVSEYLLLGIFFLIFLKKILFTSKKENLKSGRGSTEILKKKIKKVNGKNETASQYEQETKNIKDINDIDWNKQYK